jgi:hypothetical protein
VGRSGKLLFVAPVLPVDVQAMAKTLEDAGSLKLLITRYCPSPLTSMLLGKLPLTRNFSRRPPSPVDRKSTLQSVAADLVYYVKRLSGASRTRATDASFSVVDGKARGKVGKHLAGVLAREDCCEQSFRRAKELGRATIYVLPTAYWRKVRELMRQEEQQFPNICETIADQTETSVDRLERKDRELALADHVLCPSSFVAASLQLASVGRYAVKMIPFGSEKSLCDAQASRRKRVFLYVGNITMRKGVHRVLSVWKKLKAYRTNELRLIGDMFLTPRFLGDFRNVFTHVPRVHRQRLTPHYQEACAFVFNPVADGFGYVILEAMANALPVIASINCGAPDIIQNQREGLLVDYGADDHLATALDWALTNQDQLAEMGRHALEKAQRWRWEHYAIEFLRWLQPIIG